MDRAGWDYPTGDFRVSDADRDRAIAELSQALQAGRLTADEFDQRSTQAVAARTGKELTALLADLPVERAPAARAPAARGSAPEQSPAFFASRTAFAAAAGAICCAAVAAANALSHGPSRQQQEFVREWFARHGLSHPPAFPASPGFDLAGTLEPAVIAVLLVVLIIYLRMRSGRAGRS